MATKLTVFNDALLLLGQPLLESDLEEGTDGDLLRAAWEGCVKMAHEKTAWDFAKVRHQCARLAAVPEFGYQFYYAVPADCLRLLHVSETGDPNDRMLRYEGEHGKIATDAETVYIVYISDTSEAAVGRWSESFAYYVATVLAARVAPKINPDAVENIGKERKRALSDALGLDATQGPPQLRPHGSWARAARGFGFNSSREQGR